MASQVSGGIERSTDEDAAQLRSKTSENAKMQRKIAELKALLAEKAKYFLEIKNNLGNFG